MYWLPAISITLIANQIYVNTLNTSRLIYSGQHWVLGIADGKSKKSGFRFAKSSENLTCCLSVTSEVFVWPSLNRQKSLTEHCYQLIAQIRTFINRHLYDDVSMSKRRQVTMIIHISAIFITQIIIDCLIVRVHGPLLPLISLIDLINTRELWYVKHTIIFNEKKTKKRSACQICVTTGINVEFCWITSAILTNTRLLLIWRE